MKSKFLFIFFITFYVLCGYASAAQVNFNDTSIATLQSAIKLGELTCTQIVTAYLDRIKLYNLSIASSAPVNAFTAINPVVLDEARALDDEFAQSHQLKGVLHCVPIILKDNIDTFDMPATSGSLALLGNQPVRDAFIAERIRAAGGIIIGKGAMDEFAAGLVGISSRSGRVGNSYNPDFNPGGSSSGTAAAVSLNFAYMGIGSDNSGSIRIPAAFNGLIGLRPSTGLISQSGIFPRGNMDGVTGPIARDVHDLAVLLDVIAKEDLHDKKTVNINRPDSYTAYLKEDALQGKRIGIVKRVRKVEVTKGQSAILTSVLHDAQIVMQQQGATIVPDIELPEFDTNRKNNESGEYQDVNAYLAAFPSVRRNYNDICQSNRTRTFGATPNACLAFINKLPPRDGKAYQATLDMFKRNQEYVEKIMNEKHLDALLIPIVKTGSATYDIKKLNAITVSSNAGLPAITFPIGYDKTNGLPIGVELTGRKFAEGDLIAMAYAFEQHSQPRNIPTLAEPNNKLAHYSIAELNNLLIRIGYMTYQEVLKAGKPQDLTPEKFRAIVDRALSA